MHPEIAIFCPFTRRDYVDEWLEYLKKVSHEPALTNLCVIVDANEPYIANRIKKFAEENGYKSFWCKINENHFPNEVRQTIRRSRIAEVHNQSKELIARTGAEIIIGLEDDTIIDRINSFDRLLDPLLSSDAVGFVEGVQVGRWGAGMVGAWVADDIHNPTQINTLLPATGYQEITGGGFYGYATRRNLYLNHEYYTSTDQPWGPDVNFGFYVRRQGYQCLIDWESVFGHRDHNIVMYPDNPKFKLSQIVYNKDTSNGKWKRTDYEQN